MDDLLGMGASVKPKSQAAQLEDLLGLGSSSTPEPAAPGGITPGSEKWFLALLVRNDGVLFEDELIQIGLKSEYKVRSKEVQTR